MANRSAIDTAVALAEAETGVRGGRSRLPLSVAPVAQKHRRWTEEEDRFIRENLGRLSEEQIGERIWRSVQAVHVHWVREMRLPAPSKAPGILTAEQVGNGLDIESKTIHKLMDSGRMPGRRLPTCGRPIRVVDRGALLRWLLEPMNWIYVNPERIGSLRLAGNRKRGLGQAYDFDFWEHAGEVVRAARRKWKDAWLRPSEVVRRMRCPGSHWAVNRAARRGTIVGKKWGNWWILKSSLPPRGKTLNVYGLVVDRSKIRWTWRRKDVCRRGHKMAGDNIYIHPRKKYRACRSCMRIAWRKHDRKEKESK